MAKQNLPKIVIAIDTSKKDVPTLCSDAKAVKTAGDPDATNPPVTDVVLGQQSDALIATHNLRKTNKSASLTSQEEQQRNILERSYKKVGLYVQGVANDVAVIKGDVAAGEAVAQRTGFMLKKKGTPHPRAFEVVESGPGWFHLRVKAIGKRAGYGWRYGVTSAKNIPPAEFRPVIFTLECEVVINNLKSGSIYGLQEACILPVSHKSSTNPAITATSKTATPTASTKAHKATFSDGQEPMQFGDFIYEVCK